MSTVKNILVVGATGWLGSQITSALLQKGAFNVRLLVRKETLQTKKDLIEKFKAAGATFAEGDISDPASLPAALAGIDTVVSAVSGPALFGGDQLKLVEAAKTAGVKLFVPSEYGIDLSKVDPADPFFASKLNVQKALKESGLDYILVATGMFYEFFFSPAVGFDFASGKAALPGDGTSRVTATHTSDIAKFIPEILLDSTARNRTVHVGGETFVLSDVPRLYKEATGKDLEVSYVPVEEIKKGFEAEDIMAKFVTHLKILVATLDLSHEAQQYDNVKPLSIKDHFKSL